MKYDIYSELLAFYGRVAISFTCCFWLSIIVTAGKELSTQADHSLCAIVYEHSDDFANCYFALLVAQLG